MEIDFLWETETAILKKCDSIWFKTIRKNTEKSGCENFIRKDLKVFVNEKQINVKVFVQNQ